MILSYELRLMVLCAAVFLLVNLAAGILARWTAPRMARWAEGMPAARAARLLFALRLAPAGLAGLVVAGFCVPAYLWLEPSVAVAERAGWPVLLLATAGAALWLDSGWRAARAWVCARRWVAACRRSGQWVALAGAGEEVLVTPDAAPVLALAGVWRPRIVVSSAMLRELSPGQLRAALAHEQAHRDSRENLKRLLLLGAPDVLPFLRQLAFVERAWSRYAEWCADDRAAAGSEERGATLALALVRVARLGAAPAFSPAGSSFLTPDHSLAERVDRLVAGPAPLVVEDSPRRWWTRLGLALAASGLLALALHPATQAAVHDFLELVLRA